MIIPCVSCQTMFRLDNRLIKPTGSTVRCSKCKEIFMVYPPEEYIEYDTKKQKSERDESAAIPKIEDSLLDDLLEVGNRTTAKSACVEHRRKSKTKSLKKNSKSGGFEEE